MNEIKKEIEEMLKLMCEEYNIMCGECPCTDCANELHAQRLYNAGYRNCKDKVVLSKEDYLAEKIYNTQSGFDMGKRATANEVCEKFKSKIKDIHSKVKKNKTIQMDYVLETIIPIVIRLIAEEYMEVE